MKTNKIIKIAFKRAWSNKKRNMMLMVPITIMLILLFIVNMIQYSAETYIRSIEDNIELRTISGINYTQLQYNQIAEKIRKIEHVQMVVGEFEQNIFSTIYCKQLETDKASGKIEIKPANNKACPQVIMGRKIESDDRYVIIIPSKIYANNGWRDSVDYQITEEEYIKGEELLGQNLTIEFQTEENVYQKVFEVIGIYDSDRYYDTYNTYVPISIIKQINEEIGHEAHYFQLKVVVDKIENIKEVENKLYEEGIIKKSAMQQEAESEDGSYSTEESNFASVTHISLETQKVIENLTLYLILSALLIFVVILTVTNINKTYLSSTELGILKVEGYTNKDIQKITIIENILVCLTGIILAIIGFEILRELENIISDYIIQKETIGLTMTKIREQLYYIKKIPRQISMKYVMSISIIIIFIESINTYLINKRILSKNIAEILER